MMRHCLWNQYKQFLLMRLLQVWSRQIVGFEVVVEKHGRVYFLVVVFVLKSL